MKKRLLNSILAAMLVVSMIPSQSVFASVENDINIETENEISDETEINMENDNSTETDSFEDPSVDVMEEEEQFDNDNSEISLEEDFSDFENMTEDAGDGETEDVYTVVKYLLMSAPSVNSQKDGTVLRGEDNTINVSFIPVINKNGVKVADLRKEDKIVCYAAAYIGNEQVTEPITLTKTTATMVKGTFTVTKELLEKYPDADKMEVRMWTSVDPNNQGTPKKPLAIKDPKPPVTENPEITECSFQEGALIYPVYRGVENRMNVYVRLKSEPVKGKEPHVDVYVNGEKVFSALETKNENGYLYVAEAIITPEMTRFVPEGAKITAKAGFGADMEDVSEDLTASVDIPGVPDQEGARVSNVRVYTDSEQTERLTMVRGSKDYSVNVTGTLSDASDTETPDVYAALYVNGKVYGTPQKMTVSEDNGSFSGQMQIHMPDDTPDYYRQFEFDYSSTPVVLRVGIGTEIKNNYPYYMDSFQSVKKIKIIGDLEILDEAQEDPAYFIPRDGDWARYLVINTEGKGKSDMICWKFYLGDKIYGPNIVWGNYINSAGAADKKLLKEYDGKYMTVILGIKYNNTSSDEFEPLRTYEIPLVGLSAGEEETANTVADQLKDLPAVDKITLEDKESVKAARDAYDALNEDQKKLVPEEQVKALTEAEAKIAELQKAADKKVADEKAAKAVTDEIAVLPAVKNLKLTDASKVKAARDAYNKLSADQKKLVTAAQLKALTDAEARISELQKAARVKPKITLNVTSLPIQVKKSTTGVRIKTTAIKGDKIKAAKSSNKKVVKVSVKNGKLTIKGLKAGKATITVTSEKGAKATVKIIVQKKKVATKKLSATVSRKQTLKKGKKVTLKVAKTPFTAQDAVKWTSSNKKVATVTSKGVVKGLKKGTATITAKSGKKVVKFKVTVK